MSSECTDMWVVDMYFFVFSCGFLAIELWETAPRTVQCLMRRRRTRMFEGPNGNVSYVFKPNLIKPLKKVINRRYFRDATDNDSCL